MDSSEACAVACLNCTVYSVFLSGMTSHSKIAQFNCERIGRLEFLRSAHKVSLRSVQISEQTPISSLYCIKAVGFCNRDRLCFLLGMR